VGFQNKAGSIILDATLTDIGRRHMSQGKLEITKFSLGDDEVDYSLGNNTAGEFVLDQLPPTLEAPTNPSSAIIYGLVDYNRDDILLLPEYKLNQKLSSAVKKYSELIYLSVNEETTKKISTAININEYLLETGEVMGKAIVFESGIDTTSTPGSAINKRRFIHNLDLYDKYLFVYLDSRFFEGLISASPTATEVRMDSLGNEKSDFQALSQVKNISLAAPVTNYDTYYCTSVMNNIYDATPDMAAELSEFAGPRGCFLPINFMVNNKMKSKSNGSTDVRYTKFGKTAQDIFSDGNLYDYVDTNILIEGTATMRTHQARIRIIRFSGT
tara:strand:+ start:2111 stop:3094 length:984 start_codon:yes stop_codon:yes gene_type:complete